MRFRPLNLLLYLVPFLSMFAFVGELFAGPLIEVAVPTSVLASTFLVCFCSMFSLVLMCGNSEPHNNVSMDLLNEQLSPRRINPSTGLPLVNPGMDCDGNPYGGFKEQTRSWD